MLVRSLIVLAGVCVLSSIALTGCGDDKDGTSQDDGGKITRANYEKISKGMELDQVEVILGIGEQKMDNILTMPDGTKHRAGQGGMVLTWGDKAKGITMILVDNKVTVMTSHGL
jgi:hypothetical protein